MTRSSMPSKRPQTRTTPAPPASASTRACVSGVPRGDSRRRGRAIGRRRVDGAAEHVGLHHHAGAAAGRRVVDAAMLVGCEGADIDHVERPRAGRQSLAGKARAQRPRETFPGKW